MTPNMTSVPARLSVVTLGARDLPTLRTFHRGLGWAELPTSDDSWAAFHLGGVLLTLYPLDELAAEATPIELHPIELHHPAGPASHSGATSTRRTRSMPPSRQRWPPARPRSRSR